MRLALYCVAAMCCANNVAGADSYVLVHKFNGGSWEFEMASLVIVNERIRKSQMSLNLAKPFQDQSTGAFYDRVTFAYEHDCQANRMRVLDNVAFLVGARVTMSRATADWQPAADSVLQQYACALVEKRRAE